MSAKVYHFIFFCTLFLFIKHKIFQKKNRVVGVRSILATPKYTLKSAFLAVFYKNVLFCQLLTTHISMTVQYLSKILFVSIFWMLSNVFQLLFSIDLKILDFGGQIRPLPHIVLSQIGKVY